MVLVSLFLEPFQNKSSPHFVSRWRKLQNFCRRNRNLIDPWLTVELGISPAKLVKAGEISVVLVKYHKKKKGNNFLLLRLFTFLTLNLSSHRYLFPFFRHLFP